MNDAAGAFVIALVVAESKIVWYSFVYRDLALTDQSLVLAEMEQLAGHRLYREHTDRARAEQVQAQIRVGKQSAHAESRYARDSQTFLHDSEQGDYLITSEAVSHPELHLVRSNGHYSLYRHGARTSR